MLFPVARVHGATSVAVLVLVFCLDSVAKYRVSDLCITFLNLKILVSE